VLLRYGGMAVAIANRAGVASHLDHVRRASEALRTRERAADEARAKLHERILEAARAGESKSAIARAANVSRQWVAHLVEKR
jgi:hypothetical protein